MNADGTAPLLIVLRHGQAEPMRQDDASRALVAAGEKEVRQSAAFLVKQGWQPTRVIASPYRRAQQTASVIVDALKLSCSIESEPLLIPDARVGLCAGFLSAEAWAGTTLVASHMPLVAALVQELASQSLGFSTGSLAVLQRDGERWRLLASFAPE